MILGYSVSDQFLGTTTKIKMDVPIPGFDPVSSSFSVNMLLSFNGGYTFGLGKFRQETKWKGVAFDLTYRPSIIMSISTAGTTTNVDFNTNFTGFGFDLNFNNFTANAARLAPKAQSKFTFFMLPPVGDLPLYVSVGYGVTFYTKLGQPMPYQQKRTGARK
jgi:hypothetical protein